MSLTYWTDFDPLSEFNRLFDAAWESRFSPSRDAQRRDESQPSFSGTFRPRMDLHESKDKNEVTAVFELPGMKKDDVNIDVQNNRLVVSGQASTSEELNQEDYVARERRFGRFSRSVILPTGVKPEEIKANMEHGVLKVSYPRIHPEQQAKRITIS